MISFHFNACTPIIATLKRLENGQPVGTHVCIPDFASSKNENKAILWRTVFSGFFEICHCWHVLGSSRLQ